MSDRIVVMFDGSISQFGDAEQRIRPAGHRGRSRISSACPTSFPADRHLEGDALRRVDTPRGIADVPCATAHPGRATRRWWCCARRSMTLSLERPAVAAQPVPGQGAGAALSRAHHRLPSDLRGRLAGAGAPECLVRHRARHRRVVQLSRGELLAHSGRRGGCAMSMAAALPLPAERGSLWPSQWSLLVLPALLLVVVFLAVPYLNIVVMSFRTPSTTAPYGPGFTLANYVKALSDPFYLAVLVRTLVHQRARHRGVPADRRSRLPITWRARRPGCAGSCLPASSRRCW